MSPTEAAGRAEAWGVAGSAPDRARCKAVAAAVLTVPSLVFGAAGYLIIGLAAVIPALVALLVAFLTLRTAATAAVGSLDPRPAEDARLLNIVSGLSADLGREPPATFVVRGEGPNAALFWRGGGPAIGVTTQAVTGLARTELEAMIAHCLVRLDPAVGGLDRSALTLGGTFRPCAHGVTEADDARTAAITRYPPALAKAIEKAVPASGRFSYLWFVAEGPSHAPVEERIGALGEL